MGGDPAALGEDGVVLRDCDTLSLNLTLTLAYLVCATRGISDHSRLLVRVEAAVFPSRVKCSFHFNLDSPLGRILAWVQRALTARNDTNATINLVLGLV